MNSAFITGIPTAGKSYLADKVSKALGIPVLKIDRLRKEMAKDPYLKNGFTFIGILMKRSILRIIPVKSFGKI